MQRKKYVYKLLILSALIVIGMAFILPFLFMVSSSLKSSSAIFSFPPKLLPSEFQWRNYIEAMERMQFWLLFKNTAIITSLTIIGTLISCTMAGYGFSRIDFKGKSVLFMIMIASMIIPYQITMIPLYILMRNLGWIDTFAPLIVPAFFGNAFYIFLIRQFFLSITKELDEAATIDGCGPYRIFLWILLPLVKPVLATVTIFTFMNTWNDFLGPLIYLHSDEVKTLSLGLYVFQGVNITDWQYLMAASVLILFPCLIIFFFFQRYFIEGTTLTGIKG
ncbi:carbohydrate ABC transporter permease [Paenibacillus senegalensis]|uniref:carbohydrate ABC transporter permease n=1 Tax=Paenibacillus senegalensis TaxID=1465766 RepID=UPI000288F831|nr:carbohydrate ABC transporter permease [Paenibacillus senegalensis]